MSFGRRFIGAAVACTLPLWLLAQGCGHGTRPAPGAGQGGDAGPDSRREAGPADREARESAGDAMPGADADEKAAAPYLASLSVVALSPDAAADGAAAPAVVLTPSFSPSIRDYYVRCGAGQNDLHVSFAASPGSDAVLLEPLPASAALPKQDLSLKLYENAAIVAAAINSAGTTEYWVRCLPHDIPDFTWTPHPDAGAPNPGYYLVGNELPPSGYAGYALVLDGNGVPVWYSRSSTPGGVSNVTALRPGTMSYLPVTFSDEENQGFELRTLSPWSTTFLAPGAGRAFSHELLWLPGSKHYLAIFYQPKANVDLTGLTIGTEALGKGCLLLDCGVVELAEDGSEVWSWLMSDHFDPAAVSTSPIFARTGVFSADGGTQAVDAFHCNSVDVDPPTGNLLISARNTNSVFFVDKASGAVVWKMGGIASCKDPAAFVSVADPFQQQHDARLLPGWSAACRGGSGQISLFDDQAITYARARAIVYDVVVGSGDDAGPEGGCPGLDGGAPGTATVAWQYAGATYSLVEGSFRILADGSRIIGWGLQTVQNVPAFTELNAHGADVLDFYLGGPSYRALKVPVDTFNLGALRSTAGLP